MVITIDGRTGCGKSTQSKIIAKKYGLVQRNYSAITREACRVYHEHVGNTIFHPNIMLPVLMEYSTAVEADRHKIVIDESLFHPFCQYHLESGFNRWDEFNWYFDFLSEYRLTPDHSFYLWVDYETSKKRRLMHGENAHLDSFDVRKDAIYFRFWQQMERRVPFLHLIDASQPVVKVTSDIERFL